MFSDLAGVFVYLFMADGINEKLKLFSPLNHRVIPIYAISLLNGELSVTNSGEKIWSE